MSTRLHHATPAEQELWALCSVSGQALPVPSRGGGHRCAHPSGLMAQSRGQVQGDRQKAEGGSHGSHDELKWHGRGRGVEGDGRGWGVIRPNWSNLA